MFRVTCCCRISLKISARILCLSEVRSMWSALPSDIFVLCTRGFVLILPFLLFSYVIWPRVSFGCRAWYISFASVGFFIYRLSMILPLVCRHVFRPAPLSGCSLVIPPTNAHANTSRDCAPASSATKFANVWEVQDEVCFWNIFSISAFMFIIA